MSPVPLPCLPCRAAAHLLLGALLLLLPMVRDARAEPVPTAGTPGAPPLAVLFGAPDCEDCRAIKDWWLAHPELTAGARLAVVDVEQAAGFELLLQTEKALAVTPPDADNAPALCAAGRLAYGKAILDALPDLVSALFAAHTLPAPLQAAAAFAATADAAIVDYAPDRAAAPALPAAVEPAPPRRLAYFYLPGCRKCSRFEPALAHLAAGGRVTIDRFDITTAVGREAWDLTRERFAGRAATQDLRVPLLAWDDGYSRTPLTPDTLASVPPQAAPPFWAAQAAAAALPPATFAAALRARLFSSLSWPVVLTAGLIDGINPCAFATAVFLVGYLLYLGRGRRDVLTLGFSFCAGVFLCYFVIGLGLSHLLTWLTGGALWLKVVLYGSMGVLGLVLAVLHARDAWLFTRRGRAHDMQMGLSLETTQKIHAHIRRYASVRVLALGGLVLGVVISCLELVCTGQIYLPTLMLINRLGISARSLLMLLAYNIAFVLPLVCVTALAAGGVSGKRLAGLARRHVLTTKVAMGLLFLGLAALMLWLAWRDLALVRFQ